MYVLSKIWRLIRGPLQWYVLWAFHKKFIIGISGIILNEKNEVLLLRPRFWREGMWGLPSGYINRNETTEEAVAREIKEETNLDVEITKCVYVRSGFKFRIEITYLGILKGGELHLDPKEILEARFFSLDKLPQKMLNTHREVLEREFSLKT